jgi:hypothetical protein
LNLARAHILQSDSSFNLFFILPLRTLAGLTRFREFLDLCSMKIVLCVWIPLSRCLSRTNHIPNCTALSGHSSELLSNGGPPRCTPTPLPCTSPAPPPSRAISALAPCQPALPLSHTHRLVPQHVVRLLELVQLVRV